MAATLTNPADGAAHGSGRASGAVRVRLAVVALYSSDPGRLARWYGEVLGFGFEHEVRPDGAVRWWSDLGGLRLELRAMHGEHGDRTPDWDLADRPEGTGRGELVLALATDELDEVVARAAALGARTHRHRTGDEAVLLDPDSNRLGLVVDAGAPTTPSPSPQTEAR